MSTSNTSQTPPVPPSPPEIQPTVRVMRLYRPSMPLDLSLPPISPPFISSQNSSSSSSFPSFILSPHFPLPDSFGEIFTGEVFSAYVSVVGNEVPFNQVSISAKLQTNDSTIDLIDKSANEDSSSPGFTSVLNPNQFLDLIVQHRLTKEGSHTLRVIVTYQTNKFEAKTLKKFYRFNVMEPLSLTCSAVEIRNQYMVQCVVTNQTKQLISLEKTSFVPYDKHSTIVSLPEEGIHKNTQSGLPDFSTYPILKPAEVYAYAVKVSKPLSSSSIISHVGYPEVEWCVSMGENGIVKGADLVVNDKYANSISVVCLSCPNVGKIGEIIQVKVRITNHTVQAIQGVLECNLLNKPPPKLPKISNKISGKSGNISFGSANTNPHTATKNANLSSIPTHSDSHFYPKTIRDPFGLRVVGKSRFKIGRLEPDESCEILLNVYPVLSGIQKLNGFVVVDTLTDISYPINESICSVWVNNDLNDDSNDTDDCQNCVIPCMSAVDATRMKIKII